jgi:hypothetical protein
MKKGDSLMKREKEMVIRIPKEMKQDFRLFIVLHGGEIVEVKDVNDREETD